MAEEKHAGNSAMVAVNTVSRPDLPDLVIHEILRHLPAKALLRLSFLSKQWEGTLSSVPTIEFDEGDYDQFKLERHSKFIRFLNRCLSEWKESNQKQAALNKFKLRMTSYYWKESSLVAKLLRHAFDRSVKEIDVSLRSSNLKWSHGWPVHDKFYGLSRKNIISSVTSLTSLKLEFVRIRNLRTDLPTDTCLFPSLKNMSFNNVHFDDSAVLFLIRECPTVEHLTMTSCTYAGAMIHIPSSSLKSLVIERCWALETYVTKAVNLESVKIVSSVLKRVNLWECLNLEHLHIHARRLEEFHINECHDVNGTINATNLISFSYEGRLNSKFSLRAPRLQQTCIILWGNIWDGESSSFAKQPWKHFPRLTDFLKEFGCSKTMNLVLHDYKALIFPEDFRNTVPSAILPKVEKFEYWTNNIVSANARDREDLEQSLKWMAPSVESIAQAEFDAELAMSLEDIIDL